MRPLLLALSLLSASEMGSVQDWMQTAFYPALLGILVIASLGIPIPEDIPLIAAGVLMRTNPGIASWPGTLAVALVWIMTGDLVLYTVGRWWGPGVVNHRTVRWMITPERFTRMSRQFRRHGMWLCFTGRFFVGIRAVMCMTAGATRFPYWRFFLADFAGALLSVPFFVFLGYWFAGMIPTLEAYLGGAQLGLLGLVIVALLVGILVYRRRRQRRLAVLTAATVALTEADPPHPHPPHAQQSAHGPPPGNTLGPTARLEPLR